MATTPTKPTGPKEQYLAGKLAIVTGAGKLNGIGFAIAYALAEHGSNILINYSTSAGPAQEAVKKLSEELGIKAHAIQADIGDPASGKKLVDAALEFFKTDHIDIIINNAAIANGHASLYEETVLADFTKEYAVNVLGPQALIQAAVPHMRSGGRVVNLSTIVAKIGTKYMLNYSASKGALNTLTVTLAEELGPKGITINAVAPGPVTTDAYTLKPGDPLYHKLIDRQSVKRAGAPWEVAEAVLFFASPMSSFITGQILYIDGGIANF